MPNTVRRIRKAARRPKTRIQAMISPGAMNRIERIAASRGESVSCVARRILEGVLEGREDASVAGAA